LVLVDVDMCKKSDQLQDLGEDLRSKMQTQGLRIVPKIVLVNNVLISMARLDHELPGFDF